jgi:outer membrane protein assembly factor BamA
MLKIKSLTLCIALLSMAYQGFTQKKRNSILPFPVVYYTPETRWAYGAALTSTFRFRHDSLNARPSQVSVGAVFTQLKQSLYYLPFQLFPKNAQYYFYGEIGFYRYNYFYFGIGDQPVPKELYGADYPRIRLNFLKQVYPHLYMGIRYHYEDYQITDTEPNGAFAAGQIPGTPHSRTSGVGLGVLYDTRDIVFFPTKGIFADFGYFHNAPLWGGNVRFDRIYSDISTYRSLKPKLILVGNLYSSFTWGNPPFSMLSEFGGSKRMRGYYLGRFRDNNALLAQGEARFNLYKRFGGVIFGAVGVLGNKKDIFRFDEPKYAYGAGVRFTANRKEHLNVRFDYAVGKDGSNFYFTIGEAF